MNTTIAAIALAAALASAGAVSAEPYPAMAPIAQYTMPKADEIALARSAAPPALAADAEVMVLGEHGYETAVPGHNGFVCMVQRAWASGLHDDGFWNPKLRGPLCFNAIAARSVMPAYLERTRWVLAGVSKAEIETRIRATIAAGRYVLPAPGAMSFMLSKGGYLGDKAGGPWHPHLMFFQPTAAGGPSSWGANLPGAPLMAGADDVEPTTTFFVLVAKWSDGTPDVPPAPASHMAM